MVHLHTRFHRHTLHVQNKCKALDVEGINTVNYGKDTEPINDVCDVTYGTVALVE